MENLIQAIGYLGIFGIVFAESGLFFGFFLPGDSLLLTAGLLAWKINPATNLPILNLWILLIGLPIMAVLGDNVGYWFGKKAGGRIFSREDSRFFKRKNLLAAKAFYDKHGGKTIVLARFVPFIRTFAPIVAGAVEMEYRRFFVWNLLGGLLWSVGVTLVGFGIGTVFGSTIDPETLDKYFLILIFGVIFISALPTLIHLWKENRDAIMRRLRRQPAPAASSESMEK
jgi:membrane-associated protein